MYRLRLLFCTLLLFLLFAFVAEGGESGQNEPSFADDSLQPVVQPSLPAHPKLKEVLELSLECEAALSASTTLSAFVMSSLDPLHEDTLNDLERDTCRVLFDRNGQYLSANQVTKLMSHPRGFAILEKGDALCFFQHFHDWTVEDFRRLPRLLVKEIRNLRSITPSVLLELIKEQGLLSISSRSELIAARLGEEVLSDGAWLDDAVVWQLYNLEALHELNWDHLLAAVEFIASMTRWTLLFAMDDRAHGPTTPAPPTSSHQAASCPDDAERSKGLSAQSVAVNADAIVRWAVQTEELMIWLMEGAGTETSASHEADLTSRSGAIQKLVASREQMVRIVREAQNSTKLSSQERERIIIAHDFLRYPITYRLQVALGGGAQAPQTPMIVDLGSKLREFPLVRSFYDNHLSRRRRAKSNTRHSAGDILGRFTTVQGADRIKSVYRLAPDAGTPERDAVWLASVSLRRVLLALLQPRMAPSTEGLPASDAEDIFSDALRLALSATSISVSMIAPSSEVVRWFRQAADLNHFAVIDCLIHNFGHGYDISNEVSTLLATKRALVFEESQSLAVKLLAALRDPPLSFSAALADMQGRRPSLAVVFVDPSLALIPDPPLPPHVHARTPAERARVLKMAYEEGLQRVQAHRAQLSHFLTASLKLLRFSLLGVLTTDGLCASVPGTLAGKLQASAQRYLAQSFQVKFIGHRGIDVGGLRRAWMSSLLSILGDEKRGFFALRLQSQDLSSILSNRVPSPFLDPEVMAILGFLHGKALQIGTKPSWFFDPHFSSTFLLNGVITGSTDQDELDAIWLSDAAASIRAWYPQMFEQLEGAKNYALNPPSIPVDASEANIPSAVDYFNSSAFPSLEHLQESNGDEADLDWLARDLALKLNLRSAGGFSMQSAMPDDVSALNGSSDLEHSSTHSLASFVSDAETELHQLSLNVDGEEELEQEHNLNDNHNHNHNLESLMAQDYDTHSDEETTLDGHEEKASNLNTRKPLRHSFESEFFFGRHITSRRHITYAKVASADEIDVYVQELIAIVAQGLLKSRRLYRHALAHFLCPEFAVPGDMVQALLQAPVVTWDMIASRIQFSVDCERIWMVDYKGQPAPVAFEEQKDSCDQSMQRDEQANQDEKIDVDDSDHVRKRSSDDQLPGSPVVKRPKGGTPSPEPVSSRISAKDALLRILSELSPADISRFLAYTTGSPQLPPAGLDALHLIVECASCPLPPASRTCVNTFIFNCDLSYLSTRYKFHQAVIEFGDVIGFGNP